MSSSKVQNLTELAEAPASGDLLIVWDVSENDADGAAGKPKKITSANAHAGYQPLDALLTALAALVTAANKIAYFTGVDTVSLADLTAFARTLLDDSDAATARATLGLGSISIQDASNVTISGGSVTGITDVAVADGGTGASTAAGARTNLGLVIGTDVQAYSAVLAALASLFTAASASGPATLDLHEDTNNGSNRVRLSAPSSLASDKTQTLPDLTGNVLVGGTSDAIDNGGVSVGNMGAIESNVNTVAATGSTETLDTSLYAVHDCTMDQNCTFTFSNPAPSGKCSIFTLILRGAYTPTFPASVDWGDASAPTYTTPSIFTFATVDAGTTWLGARVGKAFG